MFSGMFSIGRKLFQHKKGVINYGVTDSAVLLQRGKLKVSINPSLGAANLYWADVRLTKDSGLLSVMHDASFAHDRQYSNQAYWKIIETSANKVKIKLCWSKSPAEQLWQIVLVDERTVCWDIWIIPRKKIMLKEVEAGIMLSSEYKQWLSSYEDGHFPEITLSQQEWQDMCFWNLSATSLGVRGAVHINEFRPAIILDFKETKEEVRPIIRNSDRLANLRLLLVQMHSYKLAVKLKSGMMYHIFSGRINMIDEEKTVDQHILNCKKELYHKRLPFVEEKMSKRYIANILKPVEVVLVNLPWQKDGRCGVRAGSRWPHIKSENENGYLPFPFSLAYTASLLLKHGISVRIIDAIAEEIDYSAIVKMLNELNPRLLIAEVSTPSLENDLEILRRIDKKDTEIALCGPDFNLRKSDFLNKNSFIDFVMVEEYEYIALDLFRQIKGERDFNKVLGLIYKENNIIRTTLRKPLISNLDELQWPLREQLPMERYVDAPGGMEFPCVQMLASRGCPFRCIFCSWPQLMYGSNAYRMRRPEAVVDEMEYLIKERKFKSVYFDDDTFNINRNNVLDMCKEIKERKLFVPWAVMARADLMDEVMLVKLKEAGLHAVKYGVETSEQRLLDRAGKNMDLKKAERMIKFTRSLGIKMHLTFTFGLPGETADSVKRTIDYAIKLNPDTVQFSIMTPYPGTESYRQLDAVGCITTKHWPDYNGALRSVIKTEDLSAKDLEKAHEEAWNRWRKHNRIRRFFMLRPINSINTAYLRRKD